MRITARAVLAAGACLLLWETAGGQSRVPLIIGHRGAAGHLPEHTMAGYRLAAEMGADFIEPDLVATRDGVLIARHENEIATTTDVAVRFPDRRATKTVDGAVVTGWFTEDFTLAELKTLRARERLAFRSHAHDGEFDVPTFDEILTLAQQLSRELGRSIGVYPETKHPAYFRALGLPLEPRVVAALERHGLNARGAPVFVQSFDPASLRILRMNTRARLIQLVEQPAGAAPLTDDWLRTVRTYADGIGPDRRLVVPVDANGRLQPATDLVARAHAADLLVHVWTLRSEPEFLAPDYEGRPEREYEQFRRLGVDGVFTDFPDVAARAFTPAGEPRRR